MNPHDDKVRDALHDTLTRANVDTRNLAIEVVNGRLIVKGTLPSTDQQEQMRVLLSHCADQGLSLECDVSVLKAERQLGWPRPLAGNGHLARLRARKPPSARSLLTATPSDPRSSATSHAATYRLASRIGSPMWSCESASSYTAR